MFKKPTNAKENIKIESSNHEDLPKTMLGKRRPDKMEIQEQDENPSKKAKFASLSSPEIIPSPPAPVADSNKLKPINLTPGKRRLRKTNESSGRETNSPEFDESSEEEFEKTNIKVEPDIKKSEISFAPGPTKTKTVTTKIEKQAKYLGIPVFYNYFVFGSLLNFFFRYIAVYKDDEKEEVIQPPPPTTSTSKPALMKSPPVAKPNVAKDTKKKAPVAKKNATSTTAGTTKPLFSFFGKKE